MLCQPVMCCWWSYVYDATYIFPNRVDRKKKRGGGEKEHVKKGAQAPATLLRHQQLYWPCHHTIRRRGKLVDAVNAAYCFLYRKYESRFAYIDSMYGCHKGVRTIKLCAGGGRTYWRGKGKANLSFTLSTLFGSILHESRLVYRRF